MAKQLPSDEELMRKYGPKNPSILGLLFSVTLGVLAFVYIFIAIFSRDPLWFWPRFAEVPQRIVVHCQGEDVVLEANSPHLAAITALFNQQISGEKRWDQLSFSQPEYYRSGQDVISIETTYSEPVRIHHYNLFFRNLDTLIILLEGANAQTNPVFGLIGEFPTSGALHVEDTQPLRDYLAQNQICPRP